MKYFQHYFDVSGVITCAEPSEEKMNKIAISPINLEEDHLSKYVEITTEDQRTQYANDFDMMYSEYKMLFEKKLERTNIFRQLNEKRKTTKDEDEFKVRVSVYHSIMLLW